MMNPLKRVGWGLLARGPSVGTTLIRHRPAGSRSDAWRAVEFSCTHFGEDLIALHLLRDVPPDRWEIRPCP